MKICLIPLQVEVRNPRKNLEHVEERLEKTSPYTPELVCLPECTLTGYLYQKDDLRKFAETIPGPTVEKMSRLAKAHGISICFGLIEATNAGIYNSAVILDRTGEIALTHRKIEEKPPFLTGNSVSSISLRGERCGLVLCGDLFSNEVIPRIDRSLSMLIVPMARSFDDISPDVARWKNKERQVYIEAVKSIGVPTLFINALETGSGAASFGGALVISSQGELLAESPHGTDQLIVWEFE
jgi:N-carbamoylputrescine amidase